MLGQYNFDDSLGKLSRQVAGTLGALISETFLKNNLAFTSKDWMFISFIKHWPNISQQELAQQLGYNKVMINRSVATLEFKGLITRTKDSSDNRIKRLMITGAGDEAYVIMKGLVEQVLKAVYEGVGESELNICKKVLNQVLDNASLQNPL
jgi:DNA-binding MarR family transcriptional regulator